MQLKLVPIVALAICFSPAARGEFKQGQFTFGSERNCASGGMLSAELCANAAANAQAEFDEKAPRFQTRTECEQLFARGGCSIGFSGALGWAGKKSAIYFVPRQFGFRITVSSQRQMVVVPFVAGKEISFSPRTILKKDTWINPSVARHARETWRDRVSPEAVGQAEGANSPGVPSASSAAPSRNYDPNFDCAAVLEPGSDPRTGCYPAPARR